MLSEVLPNNDWTHLADGRVRKQSAKAMENKRQEMEVDADTMSPAMVVHEALFRQAMSLISKTECSVKEAEMAVKKAQSLLSVQHDSGLDKPVSQTLLGRTWLHLYIKKQLKKPDPPDSMQFLLDVTRDSIFPDLFGSADMKKIKQVKITSTVKASSILMTMITRTMTMEVKKINWVMMQF